jgi:protein TonB
MTAIVIVALIHALLGYAFVTGLAFNVIKKAAADLKTFDVNEEPPPPEEKPPPPPPDVKQVQPPPVVSPPPIIRVNTPMAPIVQTVRIAPPPMITPTAPVAPPAPPSPPPAPVRSQAAKARADLRSLFDGVNDYPASALRNEEQGTVRVRLDVGPNGRVANCTVTSSSGSAALDSTTCRIIRARAKFSPALDVGGHPISDTYTAPPIKWVVPKE